MLTVFPNSYLHVRAFVLLLRLDVVSMCIRRCLRQVDDQGRMVRGMDEEEEQVF